MLLHILCQKNIFELVVLAKKYEKGKIPHLALCTRGDPALFPKMLSKLQGNRSDAESYLHNLSLTYMLV